VRIGIRREHRLALAIAAGALAMWLTGMAVAMRALTPADAASGRLLVIFPPAVSAVHALEAIANAGGRAFGQTWFLLGWDVLGEEPGFAARLRAQGAYVLTDLPWLPVLAGCTGTTAAPAAQPRRPAN